MNDTPEPRPESPAYVCGHEPRELDRLAVQARIYDAVTRRLLTRAGIGPGSRVIDVGCGGGDVSLLAAGIVGPSGSVEGVDRSAQAIETATARARAAAIGNARFTVGSLETWTPVEPVDAVIGRFVLMHQRDPIALLSRARTWVRKGGVVAFVESDTAACQPGLHSQPHSPTYDSMVKIWQQAIASAGAYCDMGPRLAAAFESAGLASPSVEVDRYVAGDPGSPIFRFAVESVRSMLPLAASAGVPVPSPDELETLEARLRAELTALNGTLSAPPAYAVCARV